MLLEFNIAAIMQNITLPLLLVVDPMLSVVRDRNIVMLVGIAGNWRPAFAVAGTAQLRGAFRLVATQVNARTLLSNYTRRVARR